jgi:hypothetical protein
MSMLIGQPTDNLITQLLLGNTPKKQKDPAGEGKAKEMKDGRLRIDL